MPLRLVFRLLVVDKLPGRLTKKYILSRIASRPGGVEFLEHSSLVKDMINGNLQNGIIGSEHDSKEVACSYRGMPIVPGRSGYSDDDSWKEIPCIAGAISITAPRLEIIAELKLKYSNSVRIDQIADMFDELQEDSKRFWELFQISTLCGRLFVMQKTADALNEMGIALPSDKFVVFPSSSIVENSADEEEWDVYHDMNGTPSDSESDEEDE